MPDYFLAAMQVFIMILIGLFGFLLVGIVFSIFAEGTMDLYAKFKRSELYKDMFGERLDV